MQRPKKALPRVRGQGRERVERRKRMDRSREQGGVGELGHLQLVEMQ